MKTNQELKNAALAALKGKWTPSVMATLVLFAGMMIPIILALVVEGIVDPSLESETMSVWSILVLYVPSLLSAVNGRILQCIQGSS